MKEKHTINAITTYLEQHAPLSSQESYDNSGLITGDPSTTVRGVLLSLDCTEAVVEEAIEVGANLIIAHHPIVFKGLKKLNGKNYVERTVIKAIKNDIAIYAIHTNLDNYRFGVNREIGNRIGLEQLNILSPAKNALKKLIVFCPEENTAEVSQAMFEAGAGNIGEYDECSFETKGQGGFRPNEVANPNIGERGQRETVREHKIEVIVSSHHLPRVLSAMNTAHPYEEVAHDIIPLDNNNHYEGAGMVGELPEPMETTAFLEHLKRTFDCSVIRHTPLLKDNIQRVAFCGGSGSFLLNAAKGKKADIYITGDFKYHEFFDAEDDIIIADIGHYESEQFTPNLLLGILKKNFINFAFHLSKVNTNPINYF
ncbi:MAG: Nif3-like dinuclear metal center hexameric protein [Bacteroidota bacterium]